MVFVHRGIGRLGDPMCYTSSKRQHRRCCRGFFKNPQVEVPSFCPDLSICSEISSGSCRVPSPLPPPECREWVFVVLDLIC